MQVPLELAVRDVERSETIERQVEKNVDRLEQICDSMTSCRVAVEKPQQHQETGSPYRVRVQVRVPPGHEIVAVREPGEGNLHDPLALVIDSAFEAARRQLKEIVERRRGEVKRHPEQEVGAVVEQLIPEQDCGFLRALDGQQIYFHRNAVTNDEYDDLQVGTGVRFVKTMGEKGAQASTVQILSQPDKG
ncbi:MAG: HPF/RaiA family ribosome-associated protein [Candidatus Eisenbacteria bacterium]|nr:HPF/RaiA family ribosome-associated protein [Candidatus Eisenbacteria bacterium]